MNHFDAKNVGKRLSEIGVLEGACLPINLGPLSEESAQQRLHVVLTKLISTLHLARTMEDACAELERLLKAMKFQLERPALAANMATAKSSVFQAFDKLKFLYVAADRASYVDQDKLFGPAVYDNFESARNDIREAGNCLASECPTAAVFHAMRAAEIGLRAIAYDRRVAVFNNARAMLAIPLELASWDQIIKELEGAEDAIKNFPRTLAREAQFEFYHGALMQFQRFKNVFRNRVMHTRESFDRDAAKSVVDQVGEFMRILASRIKEGDQTPIIWT